MKFKENLPYKELVPYEYRKELDPCTDKDVKIVEPIQVHCFWVGKIERKQLFSIKSFLATQTDYPYILNVWFRDIADKEYCEGLEEIQKLKTKYPIEIKLFDFEEEIKETVMEDNISFYKSTKNLAAVSDDFRILCLHNYGGFYFDLDCCFLKSMRNFFDEDFVYSWEQQQYANSALCYLNSKENREYILNKAKQIRTCHPAYIFNYEDKYLNVTCYPTYLFDGAWNATNNGLLQNFGDFFKESKEIMRLENFYPNSYCYHWHNCWNVNVENNSLFSRIEKVYAEYYI